LAYQRESLAVPDPQNDVIDPMAITAAVKPDLAHLLSA